MSEESRAGFAVWRMCRVLANRTRLKMLAMIWRKPGLTLSVLARSANVTVGAGSQYVRALEAQGLLRTRRRSAWIECWPPPTGGIARELPAAVRTRFKEDKKAVDGVFRLATAFTHVRRIEVYRALEKGEQTLVELRTATGISRRPLLRHLEKLRSRGFVRVVGQRRRRYAAIHPPDRFARALASLVLAAK